MSLSLASCAAASCLSVSSGTDTAAKPRSPVIGTFSGVFGPNEKFCPSWPRVRAGRAAEQADQRLHHIGQVPHELDVLAGVVLQRGCGELGHAGMLGMRVRRRAAMRRGFGVTSNSACASSTPA